MIESKKVGWMSLLLNIMLKSKIFLRLNIEEKKTKSRESMGGDRGERPLYNDRMQGGRGERGSQVVTAFRAYWA